MGCAPLFALRRGFTWVFVSCKSKMTQITEPFSQATSKRIAIAMLITGGLLFCFAIYLFHTQWQFESHSGRAVGTVKALNPPEIAFKTPNGDLITFKHDGWRSSDHPSRVGESVLVAYLPGMPQRAEMAEFIWLAPIITTCLSMALFLFGYLTYIGKMVVGPLKQTRLIIGGD